MRENLARTGQMLRDEFGQEPRPLATYGSMTRSTINGCGRSVNRETLQPMSKLVIGSGREPEVDAQPAGFRDVVGENGIRRPMHFQKTDAKPEGPLSIVVACPEGPAYLSPEQAREYAAKLTAAASEVEAASAPAA